MKHEDITGKVIGAFYEVYNRLGCGFPRESRIQICGRARPRADITAAADTRPVNTM